MPLFHVEDDNDHSAYVIADDYGEAVAAWLSVLCDELELAEADIDTPRSVTLIANDSDIISSNDIVAGRLG